MSDRADRVLMENGEFRRALALGRPEYLFFGGSTTHSRLAASVQLVDEILREIANYDDFHGDEAAVFEDFGTVTVDGRRYEWDIEYLSADGEPVDPKTEDVSVRGITITPIED